MRYGEKEGWLTKLRRQRVQKQIDQGDTMDSTRILLVVNFGIAFTSFLLWAIEMVRGLRIETSIMWIVCTFALFSAGGVIWFWAVTNNGYHVQFGDFKPIPFNKKFISHDVVTYESLHGHKLTFLEECIRSGGRVDWWGSHGGKTNPYGFAKVPGTERRFLPDDTEVGADWRTPIRTYNHYQAQVIEKFDHMQRLELCYDENGYVVEYDPQSKLIPDEVKKDPNLRWVHQLFPRYVEVMRNNGRMPTTSDEPGKAGIWWGSNYFIPGDFNWVPNDMMKSEIRRLGQRDKPYFQSYTPGIVCESVWPWIGPIMDLRPPDFRKELEDGRRRISYLERSYEAAGETTWTQAEYFSRTQPGQPIPIPHEPERED
jgi:hypothetical protein